MSILGKDLAGWCAALLFLIASLAITVDTHAQTNLQLVEAARYQKWEVVRSLLEQGDVDINAAQADGTTALSWTVYWENVEATGQLLDAKADPDAANDYGVTPLILATKNRSHAIVEDLLGGGADPNTSLWNGVTPLMIAARTGVNEVVILLLNHGADINAKEPLRGQNALMRAISFGQPDTARVLIENGANISHRSKMLDEDGFTPMVLEGYIENVVVTPRGGYTPLMFAARVGDLATASLLIERGADVNEIHDEDGPPLVMAAAGNYQDLAMYLLNHGADPELPDANGMTALHYAMRDGLKVLHGYNITDVTRVCGFGDEVTRCKPLEVMTDEDMAMMDDPDFGLFIVEPKKNPNEPLPGNNMYELAETLLAHGADPNAAIKYSPPRLRLVPADNSMFSTTGATPFFLATAALDLSAMEMLLEYEADPLKGTEMNKAILSQQTQIESSDNHIIGNATPLMVAVGMGRTGDFTPAEENMAQQAAKKLLDMGADVNATTATGWTALHAAVYIGANNLVEFLVKNGARVDIQNGCGRSPLHLAKGETSLGLLDSAMFRKSTADLLRSLGAGSAPESAPQGQCVLGRGGLDIETEFQKRIRVIKQSQK